MKDISENLRTQDSRITANPIFAVQQVCRRWGIDGDYHNDGYAWICDDATYFDGDPEFQKAEEYYEENYEALEGYRKCYYRDDWEFVTACLTEQGCKDYIRCNGHNLNQPRIYVYGGFRNREWERIREHFLSYEKIGSQNDKEGECTTTKQK